jgi:hypothetical protein
MKLNKYTLSNLKRGSTQFNNCNVCYKSIFLRTIVIINNLSKFNKIMGKNNNVIA